MDLRCHDFIKCAINYVVEYISLRKHIFLLLDQLPGMAAKASKISISGLSLEIDQKLRRDSSPELQEAMRSLSMPALKELLAIGDFPFKYLRKDWELIDSSAPVLRELETKGLLVIYAGTRDQNYPYEYKLTELGKVAYNVLLQSIVDLFIVAELKQT